MAASRATKPLESYQRLLLPRAPEELKRDLERESRRRIALSLSGRVRTVLRVLPDGLGRVALRLHPMFLFAPESVVLLLARFLANPLDRIASSGLDFFIAGELERVDTRLRRRQPTRLRSRGRFYELSRIAERIRREYFSEDFSVAEAPKITWGRRTKRAGRRRSIQFGSYLPGPRPEQALIRIHPDLDQSFVADFFVDFVVFHELLHAVIPVEVRRGRRVVHPPAFQARERSFNRYQEAVSWERRHLGRFLGGRSA